MAVSTTTNYSLRKHDAGDLNWDVDVNWNATEIDKKLKLLFSNFLTCSTAIDTAAKTAAFANFVLEAGCLIAVKFTNGNSASGATLNVNSTGAKAIQYNGSAIPTNAIVPNGIYLLVYDGTNWALLNFASVASVASVSDAIADGETGLAPTQNAVFDALALKTDSSDVAVTAAANKIPIADANGDIDSGWIPATFFNKTNILGTVSQAAGVPTGAVIERGSNANGGYTKFADGTFLCEHTVNLTGLSVGVGVVIYATINWTLPVTATGGDFVKTIVHATLQDSNTDIIYAGLVLNADGVLVYNTGSLPIYHTPGQAVSGAGSAVCTSAEIKLFAYGRWY